jgi:hypothetical protein
MEIEPGIYEFRTSYYSSSGDLVVEYDRRYCKDSDHLRDLIKIFKSFYSSISKGKVTISTKRIKDDGDYYDYTY